MTRLRGLTPFILALFFALCTVTPPAHAAVNAHSAVLMDVGTGEILHTQNPDKKIAPASLAKVMTLYVALDRVKEGKVKLDDRVRVSERAAQQQGARMHIRAGEIVPLGQLLNGVAVASGNDASVAVAEHIGGSISGFVRLMNVKAAALGMRNTSYRNPSGLYARGQLTTAGDTLLLAKYYLKNHPEALRYHSTRSLVHNGILTTNKNPLLGTCPGTDGLKTGWIRASGFNLIATGVRENKRLIGVVMGAPTPRVLADEALRLMETGYRIVLSGDQTGTGGGSREISSGLHELFAEFEAGSQGFDH